MIRVAAVFLWAAVGLGACRVQLKFDAPDGAAGAAGCATDQDCPLASLHCDPLSHECWACVADTDCASSSRPRCDAALHRCVQCAIDQDCAAGWRCVGTTRSCVRTCATAADCSAAGTWCDDSLCAQCDDDHGCTGSRVVCDPATRQCTSCVTDAQCTTAAAPHCDRTSGQCFGCLSTADCASGSCDPIDWTCKTPP
jgi:hypothetical protein